MNELLQSQIEAYLLERRDWVPASEICVRFHVRERPLRQNDDQPGICSGFAISGDKGFKHISLATTTEWLRFKHRLRRHGIQELVRVRDLDRRRHQVTRSVAAVRVERDSGQVLMEGVA